MTTAQLNEFTPFDQKLNTGDWYPVMSTMDGDSRAYREVWVSEFPQSPDGEAIDHSEASSYRVELKETDRWEWIDGSLAGYTGRTANLGTEIEIFMTADEEGYLYIRKH